MKTTTRGMVIDTEHLHINTIRLHLTAIRGMVIDTILLRTIKICSATRTIGSTQIFIEATTSEDYPRGADLTLSGSRMPLMEVDRLKEIQDPQGKSRGR